MPALYNALAWIFGADILEKISKWFLKGVNFTSMLLVNGFIVSAVLAYCWAVFKLIMFVYEKTNQFISFLSDITSGGSNEILSWAMDIIKALGVWNAFVDVYNIFSAPIVSIIVIYLYKLGIKFLRSVQLNLTTLNIARL